MPQPAAKNPHPKPQLTLVIAGHVDHGKSTFIGRLLHDTGSLPEGKFEQIAKASQKRGVAFEWAFLMDALQAERDQNVTIDAAHIWLRAPSRDIAIIDAPGHEEFLRNMITGATAADAALILVDAREGVCEQSRRHAYLLHLLGLRQCAVLVNKMDAVNYGEAAFRAIEREFTQYLSGLGITPAAVIPISAREGDNVTAPSPRMKWYQGPAALAALEQFTAPPLPDHLPLRFPIQDVYKFDEKRILAGRVESGSVSVGDTLLFSPIGGQARVASIESWGEKSPLLKAQAGRSVGITLDAPLFVERGYVASHADKAPMLTNLFRARIFWLGNEPLAAGKRYQLRLAAAALQAEIKTVEHAVDMDNLQRRAAEHIERGQVAEVIIRTRGVAVVDDFTANPALGRFAIVEHGEIAGGGVIDTTGFYDQRSVTRARAKSENISPIDFGVSREQRALMNGHFGGIVWMSGLSGAGKSTLAEEVQKRLFDRGYQMFVLDGDNIREGLSRDLGFSPAERSENIRRVAEVAALFAKAGMIVITAFISPYRKDRHLAGSLSPDEFHEVYVKASVEACEKRDAKGLYKKARAGKIPDFTGVSAPYEPPENPDLVIDTEHADVAACVAQLIRYIEHHLVEPVKELG